MSRISIFSRGAFSRILTALLTTIVAVSFAQAQTPIENQTPQIRPRRASTTGIDGGLRLENELVIVSPAPSAKAARPTAPPVSAAPAALRFKQMLTTEIDQRLGAPYVYGAAGPWYFDCSGFVWSVFQAAGVPFERASARGLWEGFAPVAAGEEFRFGTLVFFNNLHHVGIIADQNGFYHASRSNGVTYSPFNDYWSSRIDGFRRIPEVTPATAE